MNLLHLLLVCTFASFALAKVTRVPTPLIFNGDDSFINETPYQVSMQLMQWPFMFNVIRSHHFCGGGIISENLILTAAHCLYTSPNFMCVKAGLTDRNQKAFPLQFSFVKSYIKYQQFKFLDNVNLGDIGFVLLKTPLKFNKYVHPVNLPTRCEPDVGFVNISGWGELGTNGPLPLRLQRGEVPIIPLQQCLRDLNHYTRITSLHSTHLCTENIIGYGSACGGDSGGLAVKNGVALGVISFGCEDCEIRQCPTVYTRVCKYREFIDSVINYVNQL